MPSVDAFDVDSPLVPCGSVIELKVSASFADDSGGFITVRIAGDNFCYFRVGSVLTDRVVRRLSASSGDAAFSPILLCHEEGTTTFALVATAEDRANGVSSAARRTIQVTGC